MKIKKDCSRTENYIRKGAMMLCEIFALITMFFMLYRKDYANVLTCFLTFVLVLGPNIIEKLFSCRINTAVYLFVLFYALGPMLGDCYKLYYSTAWWDKALHAFGGVVVALFGLYLFKLLCTQNNKIVAAAIFAVCFSVTISVMWEFFEFSADSLVGTDMQHDTVITSVESYLLGEQIGEIGRLDGIESVIVNGTELPVKGYLDIGLIDSMTDMLFETLGAVIVGGIHILDKGKHPVFISTSKKVSV